MLTLMSSSSLASVSRLPAGFVPFLNLRILSAADDLITVDLILLRFGWWHFWLHCLRGISLLPTLYDCGHDRTELIVFSGLEQGFVLCLGVIVAHVFVELEEAGLEIHDLHGGWEDVGLDFPSHGGNRVRQVDDLPLEAVELGTLLLQYLELLFRLQPPLLLNAQLPLQLHAPLLGKGHQLLLIPIDELGRLDLDIGGLNMNLK